MSYGLPRLFAGACFALSLVALSAPVRSAQMSDDEVRQASAQLARALCANCHGPEGRGDNPLVPRLAGQKAAYLEVQLKAFRAQKRDDPDAHEYMWGVASVLNDRIIEGLADYFSKQTPAPGKPGDQALIDAGQQLFERGDTDHGVAACAACHKQDAQGLAVFPRLAGQHGQYLNRQMQAFRAKLRGSPVMHGVMRDMTDDEMRAVATYLQSK